ncbi:MULTISPECIES: hypothetical protein [Klebsiella/Raoultella group]|uniref:hypothetical protein n=1 Tax=Klebsiella/Raoultella group TaxID=2890311 RepID=UPI0008028EBB|nr:MULTISPECIES: hypothetical protein [Klebsiella/Raoultella group]MCP5828886.1 hypothetical protein [Klebsiella pneumoniae]MCP5867315.1 hypothetical protein [Klebsiella pneumoniae]MCP6343800.1 hypothetical protein [Klebsiella pneumoniae]MDE8357108.1 hypothetical protein [Klebsiella pneumoniae]MDE8362980.1 hypothetical protein [Klebsiella pneumoniae]
MKKVHIESKRAGDRRIIEISIGGITARYRAAGEIKELKATGRGNVRQVKALLREFIRNADPALI